MKADSFETSPEYWDSVGAEWHARPQRAWRVVSDRVNVRLIDRWFGTRTGGKVLKTDLFDEVVGGGLVDRLATSFDQVVGIDISPAVVEVVRHRHPHLQAEVADVRELPFAHGSFSAVVSNSTLDHFDRTADIERALGELHRVLAPGGRLVVLEFTVPPNPLMRWGYMLYFNRLLPVIGRIVSGHPWAYTYLPESMGRFVTVREFGERLRNTGFDADIRVESQTLGIAHLVCARTVTTR